MFANEMPSAQFKDGIRERQCAHCADVIMIMFQPIRPVHLCEMQPACSTPLLFPLPVTI